MHKGIIFSLLFFLAACIHPPAGLEKEQFSLHSLQQIQSEDYHCRCKSVRLGGKILSVTALKSQTKIEVLSLPVASFSAKPVVDGSTDGRFIAYLNGFVDPLSLQDQYITVAGTLIAQQSGNIDQATYLFPVINAQHYKQWKLVQEYYYEPDEALDYPYAFGGILGRHWGASWWLATPKVRYTLY